MSTVRSLEQRLRQTGGVAILQDWGDSTCQRNGYGVAGAFDEALSLFIYRLGDYVGANETWAGLTGSRNYVRRRNGTHYGPTATTGLPTAFAALVPLPNNGTTSDDWTGLRGAYIPKVTVAAGGYAATDTSLVVNETISAWPSTGNIAGSNSDNRNYSSYNAGTKTFTLAAGGLASNYNQNDVLGLRYFADFGIQIMCESDLAMSGATLVGSCYWLGVNGAATNYDNLRLAWYKTLDHTATGALTAFSPAVAGTAFKTTDPGYTDGEVRSTDLELSAALRQTPNISVVFSVGAIAAFVGPAAIPGFSVVKKGPPYGYIRMTGLNKGGQGLCEMAGAIDFKTGTFSYATELRTHYRCAIKAAVKSRGSGTRVPFVPLIVSMHNDTGRSVAGIPLTDQSWSIAATTTTTNDVTSASTEVPIAECSQFLGASTAPGHAIIDDLYRITYTGVSAASGAGNLTGVTWGVLGSDPPAGTISSGAGIKCGHRQDSAAGYAADLIHVLRRLAAIYQLAATDESATYSEGSDFRPLIPRAWPCWDTPETDTSDPDGNLAKREGTFQRMWAEAKSRVRGVFPNAIMLDPSEVMDLEEIVKVGWNDMSAAQATTAAISTTTQSTIGVTTLQSHADYGVGVLGTQGSPEIVRWTARSASSGAGNITSVSRGQFGTTAATHASGVQFCEIDLIHNGATCYQTGALRLVVEDMTGAAFTDGSGVQQSYGQGRFGRGRGAGA